VEETAAATPTANKRGYHDMTLSQIRDESRGWWRC
jgi:hypothetical protein